MPKKYFTIDDANREIPKIRIIIAKLKSLNKAISGLSSIKVSFTDEEEYSNYSGTLTKLNREFHKLSFDFYSELEKLDKIGCILKDLETGLIDFYCRFEGRDIFLCWKMGENRISHWHEVDSGFSGRQRIVDLEELRN
ncbi:DUF2203 domain-containing protein [Candidatus Woesearchaeota archaeon]|nr:DUF2203 domain-containing protein [Candidatus Woesearchaeota archaeon]